MSAARSLANLVAMRRGHFVFESGAHGDTWLELDALFRRPDRLRPFAAELARRLGVHGPAVVCGPMTGGAMLAQLVAAELGCDAVWTEREVAADGSVAFRLPRWTLPVVARRRVAVVDDAIAAGSAVRASRAALLSAGATVDVIAALITTGGRTGQLERETGATLVRLEDIDAGLWAADACPLCAAGMPLSLPIRS